MTPLRRRMIEDMRIRNLSPQTQRAYVEQVSRFARHFGQPPERLGQGEIRAWQIYLVEERRLAASSISVAVAALRFVYTVTLKRPWIVEDDIPTSRQPKKLPVVPSPAEVARFLDAVKSPKHRMILTVCYATGLRVSEAVSLKSAAIDSQRMVIRVEAGKGRKDGSGAKSAARACASLMHRATFMPRALHSRLRAQLDLEHRDVVARTAPCGCGASARCRRS